MHYADEIRNPELATLIEDIIKQYPRMSDTLNDIVCDCVDEINSDKLSIDEAVTLVHGRVHEAAKGAVETIFETCANTRRVSELAIWVNAGSPTETTLTELFTLSQYLVNNCLVRYRGKWPFTILEEIESEGRVALMKAIHSLIDKKGINADGIIKYFATYIFNTMRDYTQRKIQVMDQPRRVSAEVFKASTNRELKSTVGEFTILPLSIFEGNWGVTDHGDRNPGGEGAVEDELDRLSCWNGRRGMATESELCRETFDPDIIRFTSVGIRRMSEVFYDKHFDKMEQFIALKLDEGWKKGEIADALDICNSAVTAHLKNMKVKWKAYA